MSSLHIEMSAREVIAPGAAFRPYGRHLTDVDVARDEISALQARVEPLLLRVMATGGSARERKLVVGEWFCDPGAEPRRLPRPKWSYSHDAATWCRGLSWAKAWDTCDDGRWMLHAAARAGAPKKLLVLAACVCAKESLYLIPSGDLRPRSAIDEAESWARHGMAMAVHVRDAAVSARAAAEAYEDAYEDEHEDMDQAAASYASDAAACAAEAVGAAQNHLARLVAHAANHAAMALAYGDDEDDEFVLREGAREPDDDALSDMAASVRRIIPTAVVLRAASSR